MAIEKYPLPGLAELRKANTGFFLRDNGLNWKPEGGCGLFSECLFDEDSGESGLKSGYDVLLPRLNRKDVVPIIEEKVQHLGLGERLSILDVGCWTGKALEDCTKRWREKIDGVGITASLPPWFSKETIDALSRQNVKLVCGDAHDLTGIFKGMSFDVIFSNSAIGYMFDSVRVLEEIWQLLGKDGISLINGFYWPRESFQRDLDTLNKWCKGKGFEINLQKSKIRPNNETAKVFDIADVTMVKNRHDNVKFPVKPIGVKKHYHSYPEILYYGFQF